MLDEKTQQPDLYSLLSDIERKTVFRIFWNRGYVLWHENNNSAGNWFLKATGPDGREMTLFTTTDQALFKRKRDQFVAFAKHLENRLFEMIVGD